MSDIIIWGQVLKSMIDSHDDMFLYLQEEHWGEIARNAAPEIFEEYGEDAHHFTIEAFREISGHLSVGTLNLNFQQSLHGDTCWLDIYRLPEGASVIIKGASFDLEGSISLLCSSDLDVKKIIASAKEFLFESCIDGEIYYLDDSPGFNPDVNMVYSGENELISNW